MLIDHLGTVAHFSRREVFVFELGEMVGGEGFAEKIGFHPDFRASNKSRNRIMEGVLTFIPKLAFLLSIFASRFALDSAFEPSQGDDGSAKFACKFEMKGSSC